ncbi:DDE-type integrase/transposase/recombinase [Providencia alcalifaciens]|uniref:DDE-type integrase/transposase/recombinase n=1 Tax=Providencia alcalifaciens TaxID=126385 RepID=UPI003908AE27
MNGLRLHRQRLQFHNNISECDHGKLKYMINPILGFKSIKTAHATVKSIDAIQVLRKGQTKYFYYGHLLDKVCLVNKVFNLSYYLDKASSLYGGKLIYFTFILLLLV